MQGMKVERATERESYETAVLLPWRQVFVYGPIRMYRVIPCPKLCTLRSGSQFSRYGEVKDRLGKRIKERKRGRGKIAAPKLISNSFSVKVLRPIVRKIKYLVQFSGWFHRTRISSQMLNYFDLFFNILFRLVLYFSRDFLNLFPEVVFRANVDSLSERGYRIETDIWNVEQSSECKFHCWLPHFY